jgi:dienelactone hydrolase
MAFRLFFVRCAVFCAIGATELAVGCGGSDRSSTAAPVAPDTSPAFLISGNPESSTGATWTFKGTVGGVDYDLSGVLYKPVGAGPFPAVVLSHGSDGSAAFLASGVAPTMVGWGLVCIAVNYTHATGVPIGSPGTASDVGASSANVLRAHMAHELLRSLSYVDMSRVAAHGHSLGAYLQVAEISQYPSDFRVASHTSGGVRPAFIVAGPAPTVAEASAIPVPYQMHHGDADTVVPLSYDQRLDSVLAAVHVAHEFYTYAGASHTAIRLDPVVLQHVRNWYTAHGMF